MEDFGGNLTLDQMAAIASHATSKRPPGRRCTSIWSSAPLKRAQHLLRADGELGLAEVALRFGFWDQSNFSFHFKRLVGVTPRRFRLSAKIA
jgi:AraC family transcriptional regulator